ncbi:MAG: putative lipid II flippase FtsW [bacterium]
MRRTPRLLAGIVLVLLALGLVMLASASSVKGDASKNDPGYFLKRQAVWLAVAVVASVVAAKVDYHRWQKFWIPLALLSVFLLTMVMVPGLRLKIGGAYRWFRMGPFSFQPSELAKIAVVVMLSAWMTRCGVRSLRFRDGVLKPMAMLGVFLALVIKEPDYGTTILLATVGVCVLFVGGARGWQLALPCLIGVACIAYLISLDPVRLGRIVAFIEPERNPKVAYHLAQSKMSFMLGGLWGVGLGNSLQKHFYLPEAHTDFILAIIGEELGLVATLGVVLLFAGYLFCGMRIALKAPDCFGRLTAFGLTMMIGLQAFINGGVVTGVLPTKGLPLPFISYGGSSLIMSMVATGILMNIARHTASGDDAHTRAVKDRTQAL